MVIFSYFLDLFFNGLTIGRTKWTDKKPTMDGQKWVFGGVDRRGQNALFCVKCVKIGGYRWGVLPSFLIVFGVKKCDKQRFLKPFRYWEGGGTHTPWHTHG